MNFIVGVDEAGRGPLAGPVAVGVVKVTADFDWSLLEGVADSKKMKPEKREALFRQTKQLQKEGHLDFAVSMSAAAVIDQKGIVPAIELAMGRCIKKLQLGPAETYIKLDGALKAPEVFKQETIIKGDDKELVIGLASVLAKVTRDQYMSRLDRQHPDYGFARHKGYGTKQHRAMIASRGMCTEHRASYCKNIEIL